MQNGEAINYVLDCFALFAYFADEPGGVKVKDLIVKARNNEIILFVSVINLGELFYMMCKKRNRARADEILGDVKKLPITIVSVTDEQVFKAAILKSNNSISFSDAFAASLSFEVKAPLVTGDPEFRNMNDKISLFWLL